MVEEGRTWGQESESEQLAFFRFCFSCKSGLVANKLLSASLMSMVGRCHLLFTSFGCHQIIRFYCWRQRPTDALNSIPGSRIEYLGHHKSLV